MTPARSKNIHPTYEAPSPVSMAAVGNLLDEVEYLPPRSTGSLTFGSAGVVLIQEGSICWAVSNTMRQRLTDLLLTRASGLNRFDLEKVYRDCRGSGKPLGEELVRREIVDEEGLRWALKRHNAEALAHLAHSRAPGEWSPHRRQGYDPRFVFSTGEIMATVGTLRYPRHAGEAMAELRRALAGGSFGVSFVRDPECSSPQPVASMGGGLSVSELRSLGNWALSLFDIGEAFDSRPRIIAGTWSGGGFSVAWRYGELFYVGACKNQRVLARIFARINELKAVGYESGTFPAAAHLTTLSA